MTLFVEEDRIHLRKSVSTNSPLDGRQVERKCPWEQNLNIKRKKEEKKGCFTLREAKTQNQKEHKKGQLCYKFCLSISTRKTFTFKLSFIFIRLTNLWMYDLVN